MIQRGELDWHWIITSYTVTVSFSSPFYCCQTKYGFPLPLLLGAEPLPSIKTSWLSSCLWFQATRAREDGKFVSTLMRTCTYFCPRCCDVSMSFGEGNVLSVFCETWTLGVLQYDVPNAELDRQETQGKEALFFPRDM